jgi:hypothetical protein
LLEGVFEQLECQSGDERTGREGEQCREQAFREPKAQADPAPMSSALDATAPKSNAPPMAVAYPPNVDRYLDK